MKKSNEIVSAFSFDSFGVKSFCLQKKMALESRSPKGEFAKQKSAQTSLNRSCCYVTVGTGLNQCLFCVNGRIHTPLKD